MHRFGQTALVALFAGFGVLASPVAAQTTTAAPAPATVVQSQCAAVPALPTMPDGAHATRTQMDAYNTTFANWVSAAGAARQCRYDEVHAIRARIQPQVDEFNAANARVTAINDYWTAYVNRLNAEAPGQSTECRQQSHDIVAGEFRDRCSEQQDASTTTATPAALPDVSTLGSGPVTPANSLFPQCGAIAEPARPPNPDNRRERARIPQAVTDYNAWLADAQTKLTCRRNEVAAAAAPADALTSQRAASDAVVNSAPAQWRAEVAEFTARGGH